VRRNSINYLVKMSIYVKLTLINILKLNYPWGENQGNVKKSKNQWTIPQLQYYVELYQPLELSLSSAQSIFSSAIEIILDMKFFIYLGTPL
jgi:hypothetical protein